MRIRETFFWPADVGDQAFYDLHIEDMWLPYFCNTANIIASRMEIHETGYAWRFIRSFFNIITLDIST